MGLLNIENYIIICYLLNKFLIDNLNNKKNGKKHMKDIIETVFPNNLNIIYPKKIRDRCMHIK